MGRSPRVSAPDTVYHVICRGNNRRPIFADNQDYFCYLDLWRQNKAKMDFQVFAYVLMTNHVHWLLKTGLTPLSEIIHRIHSSYARWFNHRHQRVGHLFQGRYKNIICTDDAYLLTLAGYIHQNPVRSGLVKSVHLYPWSSYHHYASGQQNDLVEIDFILNYFSQDKEKARSGFIKFCRDANNSDCPGETHSQKERRHNLPSSAINPYNNQAGAGDTSTAKISPNILPSKSTAGSTSNPMLNYTNKPVNNSNNPATNKFVKSAGVSANNFAGSATNNIAGAFSEKRIPSQDLNKIAVWIEKATNITLPELKGNSQKRHIVLARSLFIKIAVSNAGIKRNAVASYLGKERSLITKVMKKWSDNRMPAPAIELLHKFGH
ncbi:transposase [Desulfoscipio sp. XC116]|uniref:REP-associated tyrosine transposase n=1 Tax=Desulfoscipio sp. XC116 TaxID=3144975 RepID=UPI00325B581F